MTETLHNQSVSAEDALRLLEHAWQYYMPEDGGVTETEANTPEYYEYQAAA